MSGLFITGQVAGNVPSVFFFNDSLHDSYNIFSPDIAEHIQYMLSDPQARLPSFPRNGFLEYRYPVAIKTGTSRGFRDAWTIGWSDTYGWGMVRKT